MPKKYNVFESVNMASTYYTERILDAVCDTDVENGTFGYLDGLADGKSVIYKFKPGWKQDVPIVVVDNPAWDFDTNRIFNQRRNQYINLSGVPFRVRIVCILDLLATAIEGIAPEARDEMKIGAYISIDPTGKLVPSSTIDEKASNAGKSATIGRVERERIVGNSLITPMRGYGVSTKLYEIRIHGEGNGTDSMIVLDSDFYNGGDGLRIIVSGNEYEAHNITLDEKSAESGFLILRKSEE